MRIQRSIYNDLLYWNKEKGQTFVNVFRLQLPSQLQSQFDLITDFKKDEDLSQYIFQKIQPSYQSSLTQAIACIKKSQHILILTGAGISAESGIPTFRDKQTGLWEHYQAEDLAHIEAFYRNPKLVWSWYQWRRGKIADKQPNPAHDALNQWQTIWATQYPKKELNIITQNVDDLHEQAGSQVTHLHGHLWQNRCADCQELYQKSIDYHNPELLTCEYCGGYIRPNVVWFGEELPQTAWQFAMKSAQQCDVFISVGTSSIVYPVAGLASMAKTQGATIIEINPNPTKNPVVDIQINAKAGEVLPKVVAGLLEK